MSFGSSWRRKRKATDEAMNFLSSGSVANTGNASFSNISSGRVGCVDSSDCASGWRCSGGYCREPANNPGSTGDNSLNDQGCGGNSGGSSGGGGGPCGATTRNVVYADNDLVDAYESIREEARGNGQTSSLGVSGGVATIRVGGDCVKTGCGGIGTVFERTDDCCGTGRCCRNVGNNPRCACGDCPNDDSSCDKFCSSYSSANGSTAPGCGGSDCDKCSTCQFQSFAGVKNNYGCVPKQSENAPCYCDGSPCGDCKKCQPTGSCVSSPLTCIPVSKPPSDDEEDRYPCVEDTITNTICTEPGGPVTSAGTCAAGGGQVTASWTSPGDGYECVSCVYTTKSGNCEPEPCDCNCNNDCPPCEICSADGKCGPDPSCYDDDGDVKDPCGCSMGVEVTQISSNGPTYGLRTSLHSLGGFGLSNVQHSITTSPYSIPNTNPDISGPDGICTGILSTSELSASFYSSQGDCQAGINRREAVSTRSVGDRCGTLPPDLQVWRYCQAGCPEELCPGCSGEPPYYIKPGDVVC